jgi:phenylpropionate dioxygenase-like ring-hydroxylating dioxygenase large terminal subunit
MLANIFFVFITTITQTSSFKLNTLAPGCLVNNRFRLYANTPLPDTNASLKKALKEQKTLWETLISSFQTDDLTPEMESPCENGEKLITKVNPSIVYPDYYTIEPKMNDSINTLWNASNSQKELVDGSWFAILSKSGYKGVSLPVAIEVAGEKLVAWKSPITSEWSVMQDVCPHRLAPLSQGRVDPNTGCIECPYHGQQFDGKGVCTKIPQSSSATISAHTSAISLPVHSTGDLLWAYIHLPKGQASNYPTLPEIMMPELLEVPSFFVRNIPYSFDFLVENFIDPSHIPFAHHSLQGVREDGCPIPMKVLTSYDNTTHLEIGYQNNINGKPPRDGIVSFTAPFYFHYRTKNPVEKLYSKTMNALLIPVSPGSCRLFLDIPPIRKFNGKIPQWLLHTKSNDFIDTDVWVHDQERTQRSGINSFLPQNTEQDDTISLVGKKYVLTTQSDTSSRAWRIWWSKHMVESPVFGEPKVPLTWISRESQLDRYENHAKHCSSCRGALDKASTIKKLVPFLSIFLASISPNIFFIVLGLSLSIAVNESAEWVIRSILGPKKGEVSSAAQFPTK